MYPAAAQRREDCKAQHVNSVCRGLRPDFRERKKGSWRVHHLTAARENFLGDEMECSQDVLHLPACFPDAGVAPSREAGDLCFPQANKAWAALGSTAHIYKSMFLPFCLITRRMPLICKWAHCCKRALSMLIGVSAK